jgi:hypothetical protein
MDKQTAWDDAGLLFDLSRYGQYLNGRALSRVTVDSDLTYCRRFLDWRTGGYVPKKCRPPIGRPVPAGRRDMTALRRELQQYGDFLPCGVKRSAIPTYVGPPRRFLDWLGGTPTAKRARHDPSHRAPRAAVPAPGAPDLAGEFARLRAGHRKAIVRTVARMTLLPSVTRVYTKGTSAALVDPLLGLPVDELRELADQKGYRRWFEVALDRVATTILQLNPPGPRSGIHPGYKWGHGTKVLSLFVRDLVLCSRYFTDEEAHRIEWWLYCPLDTVVMGRLRGVGFDPLVRQINQIDEAAFWRIQDALSIAAQDAGVPRIWFDDVWSEDRY